MPVPAASVVHKSERRERQSFFVAAFWFVVHTGGGFVCVRPSKRWWWSLFEYDDQRKLEKSDLVKTKHSKP